MRTVAFADPETSFRQRMQTPPQSPVVLSVPHAGIATTGFDGSLAPTLDVRGDADLLVDGLFGVPADGTPGDQIRRSMTACAMFPTWWRCCPGSSAT